MSSHVLFARRTKRNRVKTYSSPKIPSSNLNESLFLTLFARNKPNIWICGCYLTANGPLLLPSTQHGCGDKSQINLPWQTRPSQFSTEVTWTPAEFLRKMPKTSHTAHLSELLKDGKLSRLVNKGGGLLGETLSSPLCEGEIWF